MKNVIKQVNNRLKMPVKLALLFFVLATFGFVATSLAAEKTTVCHFPPGNEGNPQTQEVADVSKHIGEDGHEGDYLGPCFESSVTLEKIVVNDAGGELEVGDFNLYLDGQPVSSGQSTTVSAGTYTFSEDEEESYEGVFSGACDESGSVTVEDGEDAVCTLTNTYVPAPEATITVTKVVVNDDGGVKEVSDFTLYLGEDQVTSGEPNTVTPGTYSVSEDAVSGYEGSFSAECTGGSITVADGESKTCTITNDDVAAEVEEATITVTKVVVNDDGGQMEVGDFTLYLGEDQVTSGEPNTVAPGTYTVSEGAVEGYIGTFSEECAEGSITVVDGESKTCTITNDDVAEEDPQATITVTKVVVNDDGGVKEVGDFTLYLGQTQVSSGVGNTVAPGTYTVSEDAVSGYEGSFSAECTGGSITVADGESKTCTITNDDVAQEQEDPEATITVTKVVVNDNDGELEVSDFTLYLDETEVVSGQATTVAPGTYIVSEDAVEGYTGTFSGDCTDEGSVTVADGESAECILTNNDNAPGGSTATITVTKVVVNDDGGVKTVDDFTLYLGETVVSSSVATTVTPGTYTVSESAVAGYTGTFSGDCNDEGSVTVAVGENAECVLTNNDNQQQTSGGGPTSGGTPSSGGGPSGGGSPVVTELIISNEAISVIDSTSVLITWLTNKPATSRVVYGTKSVPTEELGSEPLYGYEFTNEEDSTMITGHRMVISGLTPGVQYFFRPASHASPEKTGIELTTTLEGQAPQEVLGVKIEDEGEPVAEPVQSVLGYQVLAEAGVNYSKELAMIILGSVLLLAGVLARKKLA